MNEWILSQPAIITYFALCNLFFIGMYLSVWEQHKKLQIRLEILNEDKVATPEATTPANTQARVYALPSPRERGKHPTEESGDVIIVSPPEVREIPYKETLNLETIYETSGKAKQG